IYQKTSPLVGHGMNQFKLIAYRYDLISGKVNEVHYQPGFSDEFYHRYEYDADNRLTDVYTTDSKVLLHQKDFEDHEAHYEYYKHGPLARAVIGEQQVQGIDYAYTLQGWLKGINSTSLNPTVDMGGDGTSGSMVARDALGYNLSYFPGDYSHIDFGVSVQPFPGYTGQVGTYRPLYNGNIASMAVNISRLRQPQIYAYGYDQLNRLASMDVYRGLDSANNNWGGSQLTALGDYQERVTYDGNGNILKYLRQGYGSKLSMDSLSYNYYTGTNQLRYVRDRINGSTSHSSNYTSNNEGIEDLEDQADSNYVYDAIGNLQVDKKEGITSIFWNVYGKMMDLHRTASTNNKLTAEYYHYDPNGNRVGKDIVRSGQTNEFDWYVRDAQGNVMAVYRKDNLIYSQGQMYLKEHHLYGSSRLGIVQRNQNIDSARVQPEYLDLLGAAYTYNFTRGKKLYELSNHLGNVLTTVTDKKVGHPAGDGTYDFYYADVASAQDYYPFGMEMPGRVYTPSKYRYGFNGKESDNELKTQGNQYDYGKRVYDPRVSKFLSVDPLAKGYPWFSPYQYCGNSPVTFRDLDGMEMAWRSPVTGEIKPAGPVSLPIGSRNSDGWIFISSTTILAPPPAHKPAVQQGSDQMTSVKTAVNQQIVHKIVDQKAKAAKSAKSDPTVVESDMFGTAQIGPKSVVEAKINAIRSEYNTAVGDNIRNGLGGALGYIFGGDRGSFKGAVVDNVALSFAGIPGNTNLSPRDIELQPKINWPASGPIGGVIELSDYAKSNNAFLNSFQGEKAKDFVFDPISNRLVVGGKNYEMGHFGLVRSIGANEKLIVGGRIRMTQDGSIEFNEWSGHYGDQWTDAMRNTVSKFLKNQTGRQVIQSKSMNFSDGTH
ncbi:MAG TPA: polymorphic toxin type 43 domain-containing protein, partial [Flavisolibacter sp.]|nr:polymorphic toxin type 43 domain-containing protein [Flavisolibacter sp.]